MLLESNHLLVKLPHLLLEAAHGGSELIMLPSGLLSALRVTGGQLPEQRIMFFGAGEAGTGIAELIAIALHRMYGLSIEEVHPHQEFSDATFTLQGSVSATMPSLIWMWLKIFMSSCELLNDMVQ